LLPLIFTAEPAINPGDERCRGRKVPACLTCSRFSCNLSTGDGATPPGFGTPVAGRSPSKLSPPLLDERGPLVFDPG
jgi:hypothetical protein